VREEGGGSGDGIAEDREAFLAPVGPRRSENGGLEAEFPVEAKHAGRVDTGPDVKTAGADLQPAMGNQPEKEAAAAVAESAVDCHPVHVDGDAVGCEVETECGLDGEPLAVGWKDQPGGCDRSGPVPGADENRSIVVDLSFDVAGQLLGFQPAAVDDGAIAEAKDVFALRIGRGDGVSNGSEGGKERAGDRIQTHQGVFGDSSVGRHVCYQSHAMTAPDWKQCRQSAAIVVQVVGVGIGTIAESRAAGVFEMPGKAIACRGKMCEDGGEPWTVDPTDMEPE
jgi:hypothetical protein